MRPDLAADGSNINTTFVLNPEWPKSPFFDVDPQMCARYSHDGMAVLALHAAGVSTEGMIIGYGGNAAEVIPRIIEHLGFDDPDVALARTADAYNQGVLRTFRPLIIDANETEANTLSSLRDTAKQGMVTGFDKTPGAHNSLQELQERYGMPSLASTLALANTVQWHDLSTRSIGSTEIALANQARKDFLGALQEHGVGDTIDYAGGQLHFDFQGVIPAAYEKHATLWLLGLAGPEIAKVLGEGHTPFSVQAALKNIRPKLTHPDVSIQTTTLPRSISYAVAKGYLTFNEPVPSPEVREDRMTLGIMGLLPTGIRDTSQHSALSLWQDMHGTTVDDFKARRQELFRAWNVTSQSDLMLKLYASGRLPKEYAAVACHRSAKELNAGLDRLMQTGLPR